MKNKIVLLLILMFAFFIPNINASSCEEGSFKVVYNANGGKGASAATCVSSTLSTIKPTRSGYKFLGWAKSKTATAVLYTAGEEVELTEDTTLYAVWSKGYKITYNPNGGSVSSKTKTVYKGLTYGTLGTPKRKGYRFLGWYTSASAGVNVTKETEVTKSKSHTLYAHWQKIKYTITYELNGGINSTKNKSSYYVTTSKFKLNNPTKKGYRFLGWYTSTKYKTKVTYIYKGTTGNKKYYARWTPIKYEIKFYGNGYTSGSTKKQTSLRYNKTYTLNPNGFKKKDYVFDSWNTKSDGSGKKYTNKQSIKNLTSTNGKTIKLYARWKRREYTITYELNGGVNPSDAYNKYTKVSTITLKTPTREGYTFKGWYTSSTYKTKVTKISKGTTGNKKFYAKWSLNNYSINYELNGGILTNPTTNYTVLDNIELMIPTRIGYAFKGWYTESTFDNQITEISKGTTGNLTLYAKWENLESYKITYELNEGVNPNNVVTTYTNDQRIVLSEPTRKGYEFLGWYTESTYENEVTEISKGSTGDKTFYAKWELASYKITYNLNGGTNPSDIVTTYTINDNIELPTPTRKGYEFLGWYTESTYENEVTEILKGSTEDKTLHAKWTVIEYTITYNLNGGTNSDDIVTTYTINDNVVLPTPTREGYKFLGWYTESTFDNQITEISKGTTEDKIFYAKWELANYTISYNLDNGINPSDTVSTYTINDNLVLPTPTREGYKFLGWYTESTFENKVISIEKGSTGDKTFYARWGINEYIINYVLNDGSNPSDAPSIYTSNEEVTLPTPSRKGYKFLGWYTESTFENKAISIEKGSTGDKTFYAKWELANYNITYNLNGGTNPNDIVTTYTINDNLVLPTPTREGYTFDGWYKESAFENKVTEISKGLTEDKIFYAKWIVINYTITYNLDNGKNPSDTVTTYTINDNIVLPTPTREGYKFLGWYTESTFKNKVISIEKGSTGDQTFYARWGINEYVINYVLNDGSNPSDAPSIYTSNEEVTLPTPTKNGYIFIGWYTESTFENKVTSIEKGSTGDKTFYAKWKVAVNYITYNLDGGTNPSNATFGFTVEDEVILPTPTKSGYGFVGWYTESTFENKIEKIEKGTARDITLYAKWELLKSYSITYNLDGGTNPSDAVNSYTSYDVVTLPTPTKEGYGFVGWFTESTFENKIEKIEKGTTGNLVLYAKWGTITNYSITYNLDGGTNPSDAVNTYTEYEEVLLPTPIKSGYTFRGWFKENTFENNIVKIEKGTIGDIVLYAKWQKGSITRNYDYNFYNYDFDDKLTSLDDIKNTLFNIMNLGYEEYTVYCEYDNLQDCFDDYNTVTSDADLMKSISDYINPLYNFQTFGGRRWSTGQIEIYITYSYSDEYQGISNYNETINNKIDEVISKYNIANLSDENKISVLHDYIVNNTVYDVAATQVDPEETKSSFTAYGVLINGSAVCQGYADAMALFLDRFEIPNLKVSSANHTWNLIYINGKWLHLDATWDDPVTSNGSQILSHDYYLVNTNELQQLDFNTENHIFNQNLYLETK